MAKFVNLFSWSQTRDNVFKECKRKYYYNYYGGWGGWNQGVPDKTKRIYLLKQLKNRQMWVGEVVHEQIEHLIRLLRCSLSLPDQERLLKETRERLRQEFAASRKQDYLSAPKLTALFEHHYHVAISAEQWRQNADHADHCLSVFYQSPLFAKIKEVPADDFLESEEFSSFLFEGTKVHVKLDYSYRDKERCLIYDWKTGQNLSTENQVQLACYALYGTEKWEVSANRITAIEYNLSHNKLLPYDMNDEIIQESKVYIRTSIEEMKSLLKEPAENLALEADFSCTDQEFLCDYCNFREICR